MKTTCAILVLAAGLVCICSVPADATWSHDPTENNLVYADEYHQRNPAILADGEGGAFITWSDARDVYRDIYVQRLDALGNLLWNPDGVAVCQAYYHQNEPQIVSDGAGGVIIAWADLRDMQIDVYAQRIDASGNVLWTADGVAVSDTTGDQTVPQLISDGASGAIVVWRDERGADHDIYAQRVDATGTPLWTLNGVPVVAESSHQTEFAVVTDAYGGVIVAWQETRFGTNDILAQRIDASGAAQWMPGGAVVCTAENQQQSPEMVADGAGGAIIVWNDYRNANWDIYAQRISGQSSPHWTADGVPVCDEGNSQQGHAVAPDGEAGAFVTWADYREGEYDIFAQRIGYTGSRLWSVDGVSVCSAPEQQATQVLVPDGAGGVIVVWADQRFGLWQTHIYAQRLDSSGSALWLADGAPISLALADQASQEVATDAAGGAIITWVDYRAGSQDIYAQRIERNGFLGYPSAELTSAIDHPDDQGGEIVVSWDASYLDQWQVEYSVDSYSLWRRYGGTAFRRPADVPAVSGWAGGPVDLDALARYGWIHVADVEAWQLPEYGYVAPSFGDSTASGTIWTEFMVLAYCPAFGDYWMSEVLAGYSVDNVAPGAPLALLADIDGLDVDLAWSPSRVDDEDLDHYDVHRSNAAGYVPGPATLIGTATDTLFTDIDPGPDTWYYVVVGEDVHGNEGTPSNEASAMLGTGIDDSMAPAILAIRGNSPNPFTPRTVLTFDLPVVAEVTIEVYSVSGRRVASLADEIMPAGTHGVPWHGTDDVGRPLPSGVYFARVRAGGKEAVHSMVLLR